MSSGAAQSWFTLGAVIMMAVGGLHVALTILDLVRPTFFTSIGDAAKREMEGNGMRFKALFPGDDATPSMWKFWLGLNLSHGLGIFAFGLVCLLIGSHDFDLVGSIGGLRVLTIAVPAAYLTIALPFWFYLPSLVAGSATACFAVSAVLAS